MQLIGWILVFSVKAGFSHQPQIIDGYPSMDACIEAAHHLNGDIYTATCIPSGEVNMGSQKEGGTK